MVKYRLTKKGKVVAIILCTFFVLCITVGMSLLQQDKPEYYDYSNLNNAQNNSIPKTPAKNTENASLGHLKVTVFFDANTSSMQNKYKDALNTFAETALKHMDAKVTVEGNCATLFYKNPNTTHQQLNYDLSLLRAQTIAEYLKSKGIAAERITVIANGSDKPLKDNNSPEGRRFNRRVDVYFIDKENK